MSRQILSKSIQLLFLIFILLSSGNLFAQASGIDSSIAENIKLQNSLLSLKNDLKQLDQIEFSNGLSFNKTHMNKWGSVQFNHDSIDYSYIPWESEKHFWVGAGEMVILEFIPWALAKWIRHWDDPEDNWANVSSASWWRNISSGWEYDGDNFTTNNFAHPYHGGLFFSAGRTNGYDFWESTAWSLTGSAMWEFFGETFRPAFNDWIYTGVGGANLGEITYRLASMVTDNTASGSERVWSEIFGTLISPVRGFNRAISGEMGKNFPNPEWSRPKNFVMFFDGGTRSYDKNGDKQYRDNEIEGIFNFRLGYGNRFTSKKPFDFFGFQFAIASGQPHFTELNSTGFLFGYNVEKNKHQFNVNLDFNYNNLIKENISTTDTLLSGQEVELADTTYKGFLFGATQLYPHLLSRFSIGEKTELITRVGINAILMGATPDDYYVDVEGRVYDFGPGVGLRLNASIQNGIWEYVSLLYYAAWIWTQSQPSNSKHHVHFLILEGLYPFTDYFSFGVSAGVYWRNSYYEDYPNVNKNYPIVRVFFRTAIM